MNDLQILAAITARLQGRSWNFIACEFLDLSGQQVRRIVKKKLFPTKQQRKRR